MPPKAPRQGTKRGGTAKNEIVVVVDGVRYPLAFDAISAKVAGDCRRACGMSPRQLVDALQQSPDIDLVAALMWLSRRQNGEPGVSYDDIAQALTYDTDLGFADDADEDPDSPSL
jgi:hypothetical protein